MAQEIPIYRSRLVHDPINLSSSGPNFSEEAEAYEQAALKLNAQVLNLSLENSFNKYKNLAQEQIISSYNNNMNDPEALQKELGSKIKGVLKGVPFAIRNQTEEWVNNNAMGFISKAQSNQISYLNNELKKQSLQLIDSNTLSASNISGNIFSDNEELRDNTLNTIYSNLANIKQGMSVIGKDGRPLFSAEQQLSAEESFYSHVIKSSLLQKYETLETLQEKEKYLNDLSQEKLSIPFKTDNGKVEDFIPTLKLTNGEINSLINTISKDIEATRQQMKLEMYENNFQSVSKGEAIPLNGIPEYDKMINDKFITMIPELNSVPDNIAIPSMVDYISKHGMPNSAINMTKSWLKMGDESQVKKVINLLDVLEKEAPDAVSKLDGRDLAFARDMLDDLKSGVSFQKAYERNTEKYHPLNIEKTKLIESEFAQRTSGVDWFSLAKNSINATIPFWKSDAKYTGVPQIDSQVVLDYQRILKNQFMATRDMDQARKNTDLYMSNKWASSKVNNGKITKNPPEKFYGIKGVDNTWIRKQFEDTLSSIFNHIGINNPESMKNSFIDSDEQTEAEIREGKNPTYMIYAMDNDGSWIAIEDIRFSPNAQIEQEKINNINRDYTRSIDHPIRHLLTQMESSPL